MAKHKHKVAVKNIEVQLTKRDMELQGPVKNKVYIQSNIPGRTM